MLEITPFFCVWRRTSSQTNFSFHQHILTFLNRAGVEFQVPSNVYLWFTCRRMWQVYRCVSNTKTRNLFLSFSLLQHKTSQKPIYCRDSCWESSGIATPPNMSSIVSLAALWRSGSHRKVPFFINTSHEDRQRCEVCLSGWVMGAVGTSTWGGWWWVETWALLIPWSRTPGSSSCHFPLAGPGFFRSGRVERSQ